MLGRLRLASIVQYLPMPVIGGYLAFIGYFCGQAGLAFATGVRGRPSCAVLYDVCCVLCCAVLYYVATSSSCKRAGSDRLPLMDTGYKPHYNSVSSTPEDET